MALNPTESCRCVLSPKVMLLGRKLPLKYPSFERAIWQLDFFLGGWRGVISSTCLFNIKVLEIHIYEKTAIR